MRFFNNSHKSVLSIVVIWERVSRSRTQVYDSEKKNKVDIGLYAIILHCVLIMQWAVKSYIMSSKSAIMSSFLVKKDAIIWKERARSMKNIYL